MENISRCAEDVASCVATMAALYILHLSSLTFLLLEALLLLPGLPRPRPALLTAAGLLPSLAYTAATFGLLQPGLVSSNTRWAVASAAVPVLTLIPCSLCWADLASLHSLLFLLPVSLLATATLAALAGGCCGCGAPGGY